MRFTHGQHGVVVLVGNGVAQQLVSRTRIKLEITHHGRSISTRLFEGFAAIARFDLRQLFGMVLQFVSQLHQQATAFGSGELPPCTFISATR